MANTVTVNIIGDAESLKRSLNESASALQQFGDQAKKAGDRATSIGRSMTIGVTLPLAGAFKVANDELTDSVAKSAQTEAAIKSTGGAANVTAKQVDELAQSLLRKSGVDDETIKSGENLLLTFKNIQNVAGKGNDIFNQATKATLDLSIAFGKDMSSSAILVGKALNDPVKGFTALQRAGVQFTAAQKDQIQALVESGDVMGAQKIILKELTSEVGGSADAYGKTFAGQISKAKEELKNAMAAILSTAIPVMRQLSQWALSATQAFENLPDPVKEGAVVLAALVAAVGPLSYVFGAVAKAISGAISVFQTLASVSDTVVLKLLYMQDSLNAIGLGSVAAVAGLAAVVAGIVALAAAIGYPFHLLLGGDGFGGLLDAIDKAKTKGNDWAQTIIAGAKASTAPLDEMRARIDTLRTSRDALRKQVDAGNLSDEQAIAQAVKYNTAIDGVKKGIADYKQQQAEAQAAAEAQKKALADLASGTTDYEHATEAAKNAVIDLQSAQLAAQGGELGLEQANLNLTKAQQDYTDALNSGDPQRIADAELNLQQARIGVASATDQAFDSNEKLNDTVSQGWDAVNALIGKKREEIATYGDASGAIQAQIDKLYWLGIGILGVPQPAPINWQSNAQDILNQISDIQIAAIGLTRQEYTVMVNVGGDALGYLGASGGV